MMYLTSTDLVIIILGTHIATPVPVPVHIAYLHALGLL